MAFLPLISTSQKFCAMLNARGLKAAEINGYSEDRAEILADFEAGKYDVLCNSMLLTEGWDCPAVDCVVVLRPTKVRSLYQQILLVPLLIHPSLHFPHAQLVGIRRPSRLFIRDDRLVLIVILSYCHMLFYFRFSIPIP